MKPRLVTIGVYGSTEESFFSALREAKVDTFVDLRRRRGVRGALYGYANSNRLQKKFAEMGIRYIHMLDLAPSAEVRDKQDSTDRANKVAKRKRLNLAEVFKEAYTRQHLDLYNSDSFLEAVGPDAKVVALFCVEREPDACHRSLAAAKLAGDLGLQVADLRP